MLRVVGAEAFINGIDKWFKERVIESVEVFRGVVVNALFMVMDETPQWTGHAVANWNVGLGSADKSVDYRFTGDFEEAQAISMSPKNPGSEFINIRGEAKYSKVNQNEAAMGSAYRRASPVIKNIAINDKVYISNSADSITGKAYIQMLEENRNGFLRTVNEPGHMVRDSVKRLGTGRKLDSATKDEYRARGKSI